MALRPRPSARGLSMAIFGKNFRAPKTRPKPTISPYDFHAFALCWAKAWIVLRFVKVATGHHEETLAISSHESPVAQTVDWLTPIEIVNALGPFDLDPCTPNDMPWSTATTMYSRSDDGFSSPWFGRVWLNPPYGRETSKWIEKLANHGNGIALIFARTETGIFFPNVWDRADSIFFFKGRLKFCSTDGVAAPANAGAPSCLVAYGANNTESIWQAWENGRIRGKCVPLHGRVA